MEDKDNMKAKIRALSLKTVLNGATPSEEAAAKEMIARLLEKIDPASHGQASMIKQTEQPSKSYFEYVSLYQTCKKEGTLEKHITEIDWDVLAKHMINDKHDYMQYLHDTHPSWAKYTMTSKKLIKAGSTYAMSQDEYRMKCYEKFKALYEERK
jgi:hypothetical protein